MGQDGVRSVRNRLKRYKGLLQKNMQLGLREMSMDIKRESRNNVRQRDVIDTGELLQSHYFKKISSIPLVYQVGLSSTHAIYPEYGTGVYGTLGNHRLGGWYYMNKTTGQFSYTMGQKPKLFFSDAVESNIPKFAVLMASYVRRAGRAM